ncbi:MAG: response regulator [Lachnospiraceae bacterium]|nr:response regulator [Lachnospiraceae bacterium]
MNEIILEISAFVIALFCVIDCIKNRRELYLPFPKGIRKKLQDQHFTYLILLFTLMVSALSSVLEVTAEDYLTFSSAFILNSLNESYFICHNILAFMFTLYILNMTGVAKEKSASFFVCFALPCILGEILIFINPFTKLLFYIDSNLKYSRGRFIWVLYAIATIYIFIGVVYFFKYKNRLSRMDRSSTLTLISIAILGIVVQGIFSIPVELFFEAIGFLGFMLLLEDRRSNDRNKTRKISKSFIVIIALIFVAVITININVIYHAGTDQTGKIGTIQIDSIKGDLQETISDAEGNLLRFSMGIEQLMNEKADLIEVEEYIKQQKQYYYDLSGGNCFNVYAASSNWTIIPDFDMPKQYHAIERVWYTGAKQNPDRIYISEPYIDAATGDICFTLSNILSDGDVVTAMDFTLSKIQDTIERMGNSNEQFAMIVTKEGTIVGCSETDYQGEKIYDVLPEYVDVFERVEASNEHRSFDVKIAGSKRIIFSSETNNDWQLILSVASGSFYAEIYKQMIMLGAIDLLMVMVIIVFYMVSVNNQAKAENTLSATENFISSLSGDLRKPLDDILKISDRSLKGQSGGPDDEIRELREAGKRLQEKMDNLFSYSSILRSDLDDAELNKRKESRKASTSSRYIRNGIIGIMIGALLVGLILCLGTATKWGGTRINREADRYNSELSQWMLQQQSILRMFTDVIVADPSVMDDYDSAVKWLNDIAKNYSEMSFCYMANPYNEHPVIMNNGWVPDPDYRVEERQWYLDTERSGDGYSISSPYFDAQTGLYCITFSRIVYSNEGDFLGIFAIDCFIDKLIDVLDDSYNEEGYAFMVDQDGTIINHPDKKYEMSGDNSVNIEDTEYAEVYHKGSVFRMRDYDGRYVACCAEKSTLSGFTVIVVQNWWSIYGTLLAMAFIFLVMLAVSIITVAVMINRFIGWQEETNEKLVQAAETAVNAGKAKSIFLAQMSHEIRTPINAVLGMNEMILRESMDSQIKDYASNIQSAGKTLLGLINTILDFSKIEEGKMEISPVRYDTAAMIENVINSILQRAEDKGLEFEAHIDSDIPSALFGDDMRITQVIVNLLTNAVKYTKQGRVDLYISSRKIKDDAVSLGIRVKDTGIGIKKEDIERLFESFTRLDETRNRNIEGTGLGMAIVTRLLDMMGSKLNVESEYGKGSEFSFEVEQAIIDLKPIGDYEQKAREAARKKDETTYLYAPKARLLVVDDNDMNLKVIANLLKLNGIKPDMADSGPEALIKMQENTYDIILLDHMMPKMDGIETLKKAREENLIGEKCIVIALTANAVVGARDFYLNSGFDDYLSKPVEVKVLENTLSKYLDETLVEYRQRDDANTESDTLEFEPDDDEILEFAPASQDDNKDDTDMSFVLKTLDDNGVSTKEGLAFCGKDEAFYKEILSDYAKSCETRIKELDEAIESKDWKTYEIKVHALKSTARTVGDKQVFDRAKALEEAAVEENLDLIINWHPQLVTDYRRKAQLIYDLLA